MVQYRKPGAHLYEVVYILDKNGESKTEKSLFRLQELAQWQTRRATSPGPPRSEHHKTGLSRLCHRLGPAVCVKFGEYRGDVKFGRVE
jgi:hypothetical protein